MKKQKIEKRKWLLLAPILAFGLISHVKADILDYYMASVLPSLNTSSSPAFSKPSESTCVEGGGNWYVDQAECFAGWDVASNICTMPSLSDWTGLILSCGGNPNENDAGNSAYHQCLENKGFNIDQSYYWSSEEYDTYYAYYVGLYHGDPTDLYSLKYYGNWVRCR